MSTSHALQLRLRSSIVVTLFVSLVASVSVAGFAQPAAASGLYAVPGNSVQVPAGGTGYLQVRGIAMQPGTGAPTGSLALAAQQLPVTDKARTAVYYGIDWGYTDSAPDQVALAVWWTQDGNWQAADHTVAQRIGEAASNAQGIPSWNPQGRNLLTAISQGQASLSALTLTPLQQTPWAGDGTLAIENRSNSDLVVYLPYGTLFSSASGSAIVWATGPGSAPGGVTPTPEPALSPSPAATEPAQATNPPAPTATGALATETPTPLARKAPPAQQPTDTPPPLTPKAPPATSVPPTDTPLPPAPTDTPQPTSSPQPTSTSTALPPTPAPPPPSNTPEVAQPPAGKGQQGGQQPPPSQPVEQGGNNQATSNQASAAQPPRRPASAPLGSTSAPLPPTAAATQSATRAVPAPAATGASAAAPLPIATGGAPLPQDTAPAQATVPFPVLTVYPTAVPSTPLATQPPLPTEVPTSPPTPTLERKSDIPTPNPNPTIEKPTPAPTAAPPPAATDAGSAVKPTEPPVIVVGPASGSTPVGGQTNGGSASGSGQGTPPKVNPVTGAGPSDMPLWLSAAAIVMLLGGWLLRRVGRTAAAPPPEG